MIRDELLSSTVRARAWACDSRGLRCCMHRNIPRCGREVLLVTAERPSTSRWGLCCRVTQACDPCFPWVILEPLCCCFLCGVLQPCSATVVQVSVRSHGGYASVGLPAAFSFSVHCWPRAVCGGDSELFLGSFWDAAPLGWSSNSGQCNTCAGLHCR